MTALSPYKLIRAGGPLTDSENRQEWQALAPWLKALYESLKGFSSGDTSVTVIGGAGAGAPFKGVSGLTKGTIVRFGAENYVAAANRAVPVSSGPFGFVKEVLGPADYFISFGGPGQARVTGGLSSLPMRLQLSATPGVLEEADSSSVAEGQFVWILGMAFSSVSGGLADCVLQFPPAPLAQR